MNISVIIPTYNVKDKIGQTLDAILRQTRMPDEVIVVDNASGDNTIEKVNTFMRDNLSLKIILEEENKKGPSPARNKGASLAKGEALAFLDADCIIPPNWIQIIEEELAKGVDVVGGPYKEYDTKTFLKYYLDIMESASIGKREVFKSDVRNNRFIFAGNFAIKKDLFFKVGKLNEEMELGEDVDLCKRIYRFGKPIVYNPKMAVIHNHRETFKGRFKKALRYGILQAKFLKGYFNQGFNIVFSNDKTVSFNFGFKVCLYPFSIFNALALLFIINFFINYLTVYLFMLLIVGINLRVFMLVNKSKKKVNLIMYILILLYWSFERLIFDLGKIVGSFKYKVICG